MENAIFFRESRAEHSKRTVGHRGAAAALRRGRPRCSRRARLRQPERHADGGRRLRSHCSFALPLTHVPPDSRTCPGPLFLKRQCGRTLGERRRGALVPDGRRHEPAGLAALAGAAPGHLAGPAMGREVVLLQAALIYVDVAITMNESLHHDSFIHGWMVTSSFTHHP